MYQMMFKSFIQALLESHFNCSHPQSTLVVTGSHGQRRVCCNIIPKSILNSSVGHLCLSCSRRVALSVKGRIGSHLNCGHPLPTLVVTISHGKSEIVEVSHCNYSLQEKGSMLKSFIGQRQCQYRIHEWKIILTLQVDFVSLSQDQIHIIT